MGTFFVTRVTGKAHLRRVKFQPGADGGKFANGQHTKRNSYPGAGTAGLSHEQKARLCILAKKAFTHVHGREPDNTAELDAWRHEEQHQAVGHQSLTTCTQAHYLPLVGHYAHLAGEDGVAYNAHRKAQTSPERVALHKLEMECRARGLTLSYPIAIAKNKFKTGALEELNARQLWNLVFDVRRSKHRPVEAAVPAASDPLDPLDTNEPF